MGNKSNCFPIKWHCHMILLLEIHWSDSYYHQNGLVVVCKMGRAVTSVHLSKTTAVVELSTPLSVSFQWRDKISAPMEIYQPEVNHVL